MSALCISFFIAPSANAATKNAARHHLAHGKTHQQSAMKAPQPVQPASRLARAKHPTEVNGGNEEISVVAHRGVAGGGLMPAQHVARSQSAVTREFIALQTPTNSPVQLVNSLPGVVAVKQDSLGMSPVDILTMRGLREGQIGVTFEGMPAQDPLTYSPFTTLLIDAENTGSVRVSQGSADFDAPVINAVGGQLAITAIDPSHKAGGYVDFLGGTHSSQKEFIRLNTGDIGNTGIRGYASFSYTSSNNWRGAGSQRRYHVDAKFVKDWAPESKTTLIFNYNRQYTTPYLNVTLSQWNQSGWNNNWDSKYNYVGDVSYYKLNNWSENILSVALPSVFKLTDGLTLNVTPYYNNNTATQTGGQAIPVSGGYVGATQYGVAGSSFPSFSIPGAAVDGNGNMAALLVDKWKQPVGGVNASMTWTHGINSLMFGAWYSYQTHTEPLSYKLLDASGNVSCSGKGTCPLSLNGVTLSGDSWNIWQQQRMIYLSDTLKLLNNKLEVSAGLKAFMMERSVSNNVYNNPTYKGTGQYFQPLPQVNIMYHITHSDDVYINGTTAFRAPVGTEAYVPDFSPTSGQITQVVKIKPEYSISEEIGYRHRGFYNFSVSAFNMNITHRNISSQTYLTGSSGSSVMIPQPLDGGGETLRGIQAELGLAAWHHISPYVSGQYIHATTDTNFVVGDDALPTKGKLAPDVPQLTAALGLRYNGEHIFGNINVKYVGSQYTTLMNDEKMPSYTTMDVTLGYKFNSVKYLDHPQVQLNLVNVTDTHYLAIANSTTTNAKTTTGIYGTSIAGSSPIYTIGAPFGAFVSVSSGF
ncbi:TonB-dependent receptor [Neokomagataea tanensis]|nr:MULTISPECIES: TonB-dependent receptor [Neokomagataea]